MLFQHLNDFSNKAIKKTWEIEACYSSNSASEKERGGSLSQLAFAQAQAARALKELQICRTDWQNINKKLPISSRQQFARQDPNNNFYYCVRQCLKPLGLKLFYKK